MNDTVNGKMIIRTYINHHQPDQHGRTGGRWVTLFTKHHVTQAEAEAAAVSFKECNPHIADICSFGPLYCTWVGYEQHISI